MDGKLIDVLKNAFTNPNNDQRKIAEDLLKK